MRKKSFGDKQHIACGKLPKPRQVFPYDAKKHYTCADNKRYAEICEKRHLKSNSKVIVRVMSCDSGNLKITQFTFNEHYQTARVNTSRAYQTAFSAKHTLIQFDISTLILSATHECMYLSEVEIRKITCRARCCTRSAAYARLQLWHFEDNLITLAQIVAVDIYSAGLIYRKTEIYHLYLWLNHFAML